MAYESPQICIGTLTAAADLSGKQYYFVKLASESTVNVCSAVTDVPIGVLQNTPASGESAEVAIFGLSKVSADATLAAHRRTYLLTYLPGCRGRVRRIY